jgi:hypothetical protein
MGEYDVGDELRVDERIRIDEKTGGVNLPVLLRQNN